ncbi:E3 ubiquitin-protein ligase Midline-1-like [Ruditapes philippinarum]|uniref:E3 ubiquitin-protein ligase Midline-1-like n=1 Tax=Ruditapes philippinarum TaxID=129788 RepID=UPI00295B384B|nr:E3 ubiquitin-protein ligase Midline-1-like [Ruditapes philippinarum]
MAAPRQNDQEEIKRVDIDDILKCPLCLDTFETPRALACLHTFCEPCLEFYFTDCKASIKDGKLDKIECPVCGHLTVPQDVLKHPHAMVKDLPLNHFILPHLEGITPREPRERNSRASRASRVDSRQKKTVNFTQSCGSCGERGMLIEATSYCHDCGDFQCGECTENHSKIKMLTRHNVVSIEKVTSASPITNSFDKHYICLVHQNEDVRFFCANHDVILCSSCAVASHKACELVNEFEELGMHLRHDDQTDKLRNNMKGLQTALNDMVEAIRTNNYGIKRETEEIPRRIESLKAKVLRMFDYLEEETALKIQEFQKEQEKKNADKAFKCKQLLVAIEGSSASLDTVIEHGSNSQLFLTFQKIKNQLQEYDNLVKEEKDSLTCSSLKLKVVDALETIVNTTEQLGEVFVESVKPDLADLPPLLFVKKEEPVADRKPEFIKSGKLKMSDVNIVKSCIAVTYMDKKLALVFEVNNRAWFSYTFSLISTDKLEEIYTQDLKRDPKNIICIDSNNVAITFPNGGFIEFYLYTPKRKKKPLNFVLDHTIKCDIRDTVITKYNKTMFGVSTGNYFLRPFTPRKGS